MGNASRSERYIHTYYFLSNFLFLREINGLFSILGRVYYVDHNTRTTTWQRPNSERLQCFASWQGERAQVLQMKNQRLYFHHFHEKNDIHLLMFFTSGFRFLYPDRNNGTATTTEDDSLGNEIPLTLFSRRRSYIY